MPRTAWTVPDMGARMRETDPYRKPKTPQELAQEAADARYQDMLRLERDKLAMQDRQFGVGLAAQERQGQQAGIRGIAAGQGSMSGAAAKYLLEQASGEGETYADRLARANAAYADRVRRSNMGMMKGQAAQNAADAARMAASPTDTRRMTWQAPGGEVRELRGQEADFDNRAAEAYSQMVGTQAELVQKYPDRMPVDPAIEQQRRYAAQQAAQASTRALPADMQQELGILPTPNMPGGPGTTAPAPKPALNITGMAEYQQAMRGEAFGPQGSTSRRELGPEEYARAEQSFSANAPVRMPYTEGPGTARGRGAPVSMQQDRENQRTQQLNMATGGGTGWSSQIVNMEKNLAAARPQFKEQWQKDKDKLANDFMRKVPDPDDRMAIVKMYGLDQSWAGNMKGSDNRLSGMPAGAGPTGQTATGPDANTAVLPVSRFNEGMAARTVDAGAPLSPEQYRAQRLAELQGQGKQAQVANTTAQDWLKANPAAAPGSRFQEDPMVARAKEADIRMKELAGEKTAAEIENFRRVGPQPTPLDATMAERPMDLSDPSAGYSEAWDSWGNRADVAANTVESQINGIQNETLRKQKALEVQGSPAYNKYLRYSTINPDDEQTILSTFYGPWMPGRGGRASGMLGDPDRKAIIANARKLIAASRRIVAAVNMAMATKKQE